MGDPRENRLTEIFGTVLGLVPDLARTLATVWLDPDQTHAPRQERARTATSPAWDRVRRLDDGGTPSVSTQVPVAGGFVDLELRFPADGGERGQDTVVWIEVKHGTGLHGQQLATYDLALQATHVSRGGTGAIVLLDRRHKLPQTDERDVPPTVAQRSWEQTGREIARFETDDAVSVWMCRELLAYMQEENLMDPVTLGPEHLTALAYAGQANKGLEAICQRAESLITERFRVADHTGRGARHYGEGYWATWGDGEWLEWHLLRKGGHGPLEIRAGLCADKHRQFDATVERQLRHGIQIGRDLVAFDRWHGPKERLMRVARPQDVLVGADLDIQADSLARWVVETLTAVEATTARTTDGQA
jgi:hypothetical protein